MQAEEFIPRLRKYAVALNESLLLLLLVLLLLLFLILHVCKNCKLKFKKLNTVKHPNSNYFTYLFTF